MYDRSELESLDVTWSMDTNVAVILKALNNIDRVNDSDKRTILDIIEDKVLKIEDYFCRPVDSKEVYEKLSANLEYVGDAEKASEFHKRIAKMESELFEFKGRLHNFFGKEQ